MQEARSGQAHRNAPQTEVPAEDLVDEAEDVISNKLEDAKERVAHEVYEWAHVANDAVTALLFLVGSIFFLYDSLKEWGIWLFIIGSAQMMVGPIIRTFNKIYVRRIRKQPIHW